MLTSVRIDKWLWAVRICKTRKLAGEMCKGHKVLILGQPVKPSKEVMPGQIVIVKRDGVEWQYKVLACLDKRVSAPLSREYREDVTPQETLDRLALLKLNKMPQRPKGAGRPTKRERRELERFKDVE